jgi:hypothetical protein
MDYHDSLTGLDHRYERFLSHHCSIHDQVCNPYYTVTPDIIRNLAARDETLSDGAYVAVSEALRDGDEDWNAPHS